MSALSERPVSRSEILRRLRAKIDEGRAIIGAGSSAGIVAKAAEAGGADLIICYSTGKSRIMGLPTTDLGFSNQVTLSMYDEIANVVDYTPIIGGAQASDPTFRRLPKLLDAFRETGYDGIINFPSAGKYPDHAKLREHTGQGLQREGDMVALARSLDYFTLGYAYTVEQARVLCVAGVDVLVAHAGWTSGGDIGAPSESDALQRSFDHVQAIFDVGKAENPESILLAHGGAIATPEETERLYAVTDAQGFVGASSIERIPIEQAVKNVVREFGTQLTHPLKGE